MQQHVEGLCLRDGPLQLLDFDVQTLGRPFLWFNLVHVILRHCTDAVIIGVLCLAARGGGRTLYLPFLRIANRHAFPKSHW